MTQPARGRLNQSLLQPLERPLLAWLAARMPAWVTSDRLTAFGVFGALVTAAGYALAGRHIGFVWLASLGLVIQWFGDSLDGTLARFRRRERPRYGHFIDHTTDIFTQFIIILSIGFLPFVRFECACLALIGYYMAACYEHIRANVTGTLRISVGGGIGPTESRLILMLANAAMFVWIPGPIVTWWAPLSAIDLALLGFFAASFVTVAATYVADARRFSREDPPRSS